MRFRKMDDKTTINELRDTALRNKKNIKYKTLILNIQDKPYLFRIMGVGQKTIRLDCYFNYEGISEHSDDPVESELIKMINTVYD